MTCRIFESARLHGSVRVPPAKDEMFRALLLAALGRGHCRVHGLPPALWGQNMEDSLAALGARASWEGDILRVEPGPQGPGEGPLGPFGPGFPWPLLAPALWVRGRQAALMLEREPEGPLLTALEGLRGPEDSGITLNRDSQGAALRLEISGKLHAGDYQVEGAVAGPLVPGLLTALSHATDRQGQAAPSRLTVTGPMAHRSRVDRTLEWMGRFGRPYEEKEPGVFILSPSQAAVPEDLELSGDWAQGAALLCANALGSGVRVENLRGSAQGPGGDARILALLGEMGLSVFGTREEWYLTSPSRAPLLPLKAHCGDVADLSPLLALLCTQAWGESVLSGIGGSGAKGLAEATVALLTQMGARAALCPQGDALVIRGPSRLQGGFQVDAAGDTRLVLLAALAALVAEGPLAVSGAEVLDQSWPGFLALYQALGGKASCDIPAFLDGGKA